MSKKRNLDKEGLEVYFLNLLLAYRPLLQIYGIILIIFSVVIISNSPTASFITLSLGVILILTVYSYKATLIIAKFGAWLGTAFHNGD